MNLLSSRFIDNIRIRKTNLENLTIVFINWRLIKKLYKPFLMISTRLLYLIDGCFLFNKILKSIANDLH